MILSKLILSIIFVYIHFGCSSTRETTKSDNQVLTNTPKLTSSINLEITIPTGWREIEDNHNQIFEIWLVNGNNNATICFIPIHIDPRLGEKSYEGNFNLVEQIIINEKKSSGYNFEILDRKVEGNNHLRRSIKYKIDGTLQNSIIFGNGDVYYECLAYFNNNYKASNFEIEQIFEIQENIVQGSIIK